MLVGPTSISLLHCRRATWYTADSGRNVDSSIPQASLTAVDYRTICQTAAPTVACCYDVAHAWRALVTARDGTLINMASQRSPKEHPHHEPVTERSCGQPKPQTLVCSATMALLKRGCARRISLQRRLPTTGLPDRNLCKHQPEHFLDGPRQAEHKFHLAHTTSCKPGEMVAERLLSHISMHKKKESQNGLGDHLALKALSTALKFCLVSHLLPA